MAVPFPVIFRTYRASDKRNPPVPRGPAPECIRDAAAEPRPYTDVYGLGLILYELLTGRPPFDGATAAEVREEVLRDPALLSVANAEVSSDLEWLCLRCLRKNPWRRFARAYDVVSRASRLLREVDDRRASTPRPLRPGRGNDGLGSEIRYAGDQTRERLLS